MKKNLYSGETGAELLESQVHMVLHRTKGDTQALADFLVGQILKIAEGEHFPAPGESFSRASPMISRRSALKMLMITGLRSGDQQSPSAEAIRPS